MRIVGTSMTLRSGAAIILQRPDRMNKDVRLEAVPNGADTAVPVFLNALEAESLGRELIAYAKESRDLGNR